MLTRVLLTPVVAWRSYLGISKRMNALWLTLRSAASDLVTFTFG